MLIKLSIYLALISFLVEDTRCVMVTDLRNGHVFRNELGCLYFSLHKYLWEWCECNDFLSVYWYLVGQISSLTLLSQLISEKGNSKFQPVKPLMERDFVSQSNLYGRGLVNRRFSHLLSFEMDMAELNAGQRYCVIPSTNTIGKGMNHIFCLHLWVHIKADWVLWPWYGN